MSPASSADDASGATTSGQVAAAEGDGPPTANRDIVVIGASAGGVEALGALVRALPAELPAAVFVVLHVLASGTSVLPTILSRAGALPAAVPFDGEAIERGQIYVAPPDHHMLVKQSCVRITRGPRENGHRPAIDPLFRSAARAYGPRVIGVILSGLLDDGAAGLRFVKERGGMAVIQDPEDALYPGMPLSAAAITELDGRVPIRHMADKLCALLETEVEVEEGVGEAPADQAEDLVEIDPSVAALVEGPPSALSCPECGGALWEQKEGSLVRFTCQVGHAYSPESLVTEQGRALETALWSALRALEERADLLRRIARRSERGAAERLETRARAADEHAGLIRDTLVQIGRLAGDSEASR